MQNDGVEHWKLQAAPGSCVLTPAPTWEPVEDSQLQHSGLCTAPGLAHPSSCLLVTWMAAVSGHVCQRSVCRMAAVINSKLYKEPGRSSRGKEAKIALGLAAQPWPQHPNGLFQVGSDRQCASEHGESPPPKPQAPAGPPALLPPAAPQL